MWAALCLALTLAAFSLGYRTGLRRGRRERPGKAVTLVIPVGHPTEQP